MSDIPDGVALALRIGSAMAAQTASVTDQVHRSFVADVYRSRMRNMLIREAVNALLDGPYTPNPDRIRAALFPSETAIVDALDNNYPGWRDDVYPQMRETF